MIFNKEECQNKYECIDWVDHLDDELVLGAILKSENTGFWYFKPESDVVFECGNAKRISEKLAELNRGGRKVQ